MKERPIFFSGAMVRALLAGTKTQTRRTVKPQPAPGQGIVNAAYCRAPHLWLRDGPCDESDSAYEWSCPYGTPGDRLWVRESFAHIYSNNKVPASRRPEDVAYMADALAPDADVYGPWKPSIHMPRWASRILLEVTEVRVERLQNISEADALAEGIVPHVRGGWHWHPHNPADMDDWHQFGFKTAAFAYRDLWERLGGDWSANPWVWAVSFRIVSPIAISSAPKEAS